MKKSKMSLINELALLENIDIKKLHNSHDNYQQGNPDNESLNYFNKLNFHLKSRNLLKNEFFSKFLFDTNYTNNMHFKTQKLLKPKKLNFPTKIKTIYNENNSISKIKNNSQKSFLSLNILNYRKNKIKTINSKKFSHEEYRRKKYVNHLPLFSLNDDNNSENGAKESFIKNKNFNTFLYQKIDNKAIKEIIPNYFLSVKNKSKIGDNLFKIIHNNIHNIYTTRVESKKIINPRIIKNTNLSKIIYKKNVIDIIKSKNKPLFFISTNMKNINYKKWKSLSIYEKKSYQKMMQIFLELKKEIEENPKQKFEIIQNFLIKNGINDQKYFNKLNNFILYINRGDIKIDATKNLKNNIIDILKEIKDNKEENNKK